jgi:type 2 lantibiotic biosynthesis protein LanM
VRAPQNTESALADLAASAASLWERLDGGYVPLASATSQEVELCRQRLERWCDKAAGGNPERFATRLRWIGRSRADVLPYLGRVRLAGAPPAWVSTFAQAMTACNTAEELSRAESHPFGDLLASFVHVGRARLEPLLGGARELFAERADADLVDELVRRLSYLAAPSLYVSFAEFRAASREPADPASDRVYRAFAGRFREESAWTFFQERAALARLLALTVDFWVEGVRELGRALGADRAELERTFAHGCPLGRITHLRPGLSDLHNGHRAVMHVTFESGLELYFKPRDLGIESAWYALLDALRAVGGDLRSFRVVTSGSHGWVEPARREPCRDAAEARRFYERAGALLCLEYALEASDCFYENIVASGGQPVLIDHETLMHHVLRFRDSAADTSELADDVVFNSVLRAGFLPSWETGQDGACVDISGLGATPGQVTSYRTRRWQHVNTDAMTLGHEPIRVDSDVHLPKIGERVLSPVNYTEQLVAGFAREYDRLLAARDALLAPGGPIERLGQQNIRLVFHATRIYGLLLKRLCSPRHLRAGVDRSIELDVISRFYLESPEKSPLHPILRAELTALELGDIPYFSVAANTRRLDLPTGDVLEDAFEETAVHRVQKRLERMSVPDRALQIEFVRASIGMSAELLEHPALAAEPLEPRARGAPASDESAPPILDDRACIDEATRIAAQIAERAIVSRDGHRTWIAPQLLQQTGRRHLSPLRMDLYGGIGGLVLLFSALQRVTGDGASTARAALATLRAFLRGVDRPTLLRRGYGLGAATGLGSFLYVLARAATLLDDREILTSAESALDLLDPEWIQQEREFDVMAGAAGAILGLVAHYRATGSERAVDLAGRCARHLLQHQRPTPHGGAAWPSKHGRFLTGLSHGAAGVALALLRVYELTHDRAFFTAAAEALRFETAVFDANQSNWPDFRAERPEQPVFMDAWCHGAPGIGLARLSMLRIHDDPAIGADVDAALQRVVRTKLTSRDGLCCGNSGRIDLVLSVAREREEPGLLSAARAELAIVVARARRRGYRSGTSPGAELFDPSLFQGVAGVAYTLLRCASQEVPAVTVFE